MTEKVQKPSVDRFYISHAIKKIIMRKANAAKRHGGHHNANNAYDPSAQQFSEQQYYGGYDMNAAPDYQPPEYAANPPPSYNMNQPYGQPQMQMPGGFQIPGQNFLGDPMVTNMAMQYGSNALGQGSQIVQQNIEKYMETSRLKYYFAVDNMYVAKKLLLLFFPYSQTNWALQYDTSNQPVAPRYDVNAPDLYIPVMAFVTYIVTSGLVLGTQNRFTPEHLGMQTSTTLGWLLMEILLLMFTLYVLNIQTSFRYLDLIAYAGYKYVGMLFVLLAGLIFHSSGYYFSLLWCSVSLAFFLIRTLKLQILRNADTGDAMSHGNKRGIYMLIVIALIQPIVIWWLTSSIMFGKK